MMQGQSDAGQTTEPTDGESSWLVAKLLEVDGWGCHHPLDHQCSIEIQSELHEFPGGPVVRTLSSYC